MKKILFVLSVVTFYPLVVLVYFIDRMILLPVFWKNSPSLDKWTEDVTGIAVALIRVAMIGVFVLLIKLIQWYVF